ncbi:MAG: amidohydrolase family protein [bacterium]|nr:amidohydrolase family protein [bacterium]
MKRSIQVLALLVALPLAADEATTLFSGATVLPITGPPIENGYVLVRGAKIDSVGPASRAPQRADHVVDVGGRVIMPGLVDTHSHLGGVSGGDRSGPLHPGVRALDGINIHDDSLWRARAGGLTTINVMPGSGHLMSGQTVYLKLRSDPRSIEDWMFCDDPIAGICGSMKMANGTNSMNGDPFPGTRAKSAAMVRDLFVRAQNYRAGSERADEDDGSKADRDLELEAVLEVLDGRRRVQHHTHRHDDVATILRLQREFGFDLVLQHGTETWMLADELAEADIGVSFTLVDSPGGKEEILRMRMDGPALLQQAGVDVSINTDDWITDSRLFLRTAALAVRHGMTREGALEAVTLAAARHLGLEDRVGSLEPGKDADLVILSGDPLSVYTHVLETWVEGQRVYDASNPEHAKYNVGGWQIYRTAAGHDHTGCR